MLHAFLRGTAQPDGSLPLWHATFDGAAWSPWEDLGGNLTVDRILSFRFAGAIHVLVEGGAAEVFEKRSTDEGKSWSDWLDLKGSGDGLNLLPPEGATFPSVVTIPGPTTFNLS